MELRAVEELVQAEMVRTGIAPRWQFKWDYARRRAGATRHREYTITLSRTLMALYDEELVREVILHEIAHAIAGAKHKHDSHWQATARQLGSTGRASIPSGAPQPPANWHGYCPQGHFFERYRKPRGGSCSKCASSFDPRYLITWQRAA